MSNSVNKLVDTILEAIDIKMSKEPKEYSTQAEVLRVDGKTAWVHIPGGAPETPAKETIACKKGDIVQVHVENGVATLTGNGTAPPTDDAAANAAQATATAAEVLAQEGKDEADNTSQYFWYQNGNGSEAGAHVTEIPGEDFRRKPQGGNLLMKSTGVFLRYALTKLVQLISTGLSIFEPTDGTNPVLQALSSGVVVGKETGNHIKIDTTEVGFWAVDKKLFAINLDLYNNMRLISTGTNTNAYLQQYATTSGTGRSGLYADSTYSTKKNSRVQTESSSINSFSEVYAGCYDGNNNLHEASAKVEADTSGSEATISADEIHLDGALRETTETITLTSSNFTTTTGTFSSASLKRVGNTLELNLLATVNATVNAGSNLYVGTFKLADYRPQVNVYGVGYYGSAAIVGILRTDGTITLRVTGAAVNPTTPASNAGVSFTYLI